MTKPLHQCIEILYLDTLILVKKQKLIFTTTTDIHIKCGVAGKSKLQFFKEPLLIFVIINLYWCEPL